MTENISTKHLTIDEVIEKLIEAGATRDTIDESEQKFGEQRMVFDVCKTACVNHVELDTSEIVIRPISGRIVVINTYGDFCAEFYIDNLFSFELF